MKHFDLLWKQISVGQNDTIVACYNTIKLYRKSANEAGCCVQW